MSEPGQGGNPPVQTEFDFMSHVPEEFRGDEYSTYWNKTKDFPTFVKNAINADKEIGARVRVPTDESPPEDWDKFYKKLGRPDDPKEYELGEELDPKFKEWAQSQFHKYGLPKSKAKQFTDEYAQFITENYTISPEAQEAEAAHQRMELKNELQKPTEWGRNYDRNMGLINRFLDSELSKEWKDKFDQSNLANDKETYKLLAKVSNLYAEADLIPAPSGSGMSKEQALARIAEINSDKNYTNPRSDSYQSLRNEARELYQIAYGG